MGVLERDYIITLVLRAISADAVLGKELVLKGGTALHKLYLGQRFSLDLDFTARRPMTVDDVREVVEIAEIQGVIKEHRLFPDAFTIQRLGFVGPLNHPSSIKVDVSLREDLLMPPLSKPLTSPYFDEFSIQTFVLEEMLAEKLRAALMRRQPRDFYDIWAMLTMIEIDLSQLPELLRSKLETVGVKYEEAELLANLNQVGIVWDQDLRQLMREVPDFDQVAADLRELLAALPL